MTAGLQDAASAFFWLFVAQVLHVWFQYDWDVAGRVLYVDRIVYVVSLGAYAGWLTVKSKAPGWAMHLLGVSAVLGISAIFLDRAIAMPLIWALQIAILIGLVLWTHATLGQKWPFALLLIASASHAIGALTYFPLCQLAVSDEWVASPGATYVCDEVFGPLVGSGLLFGGAALIWACTLGLAMRAQSNGTS